MMKVGEAQKDDRTMVDALLFGVKYLSSEQSPSLQGLSQAIREGADYAKGLVAQKGRSAYLDNQVVGLHEPGCELAAFIFQQITTFYS